MDQANASTIGRVTKTKNDARLKRSFLFSWNESSSGDQLLANDLIFTNEDSSASFELSQGQEVSVKSQTLLRVKKQSLEIKNGEVELSLNDPGKKLIIIVGDQEYTLTPEKADTSATKLKITSKGSESVFQVKEGSLNIKSKNIDISAKAGEEVKSVSSEATKGLTEVEAIFPKDQTLTLSDNDTVVFQVIGLPQKRDSQNFRIELRNENNKLEKNFSPEDPIQIPAGSYTWRVISEGEAISHPAEFSVVQKLNAPSLLSPRDLEEIIFYQERAIVDFSWSAPSAVLQIMDRFQNLFFSEFSEDASRSVEFKKEGTYKWRARSQKDLAQSPWSESRSLILTKADYEQGAPVVIELKRPNQLAKFNWETAPGKSATFILSKTKDFKNIIHKEDTQDKTSASVIIPEIGIYYWKVQGSDASFSPKSVLIKPSPAPLKPSAPPALRLKLKEKTGKSTFIEHIFSAFIAKAYASEYEETQVSFPAIEEAKLYEIEIYIGPRLIESIKVLENSFKWTPPRAGNYTWRIRYQDYWGRWSPFSDPAKLTVAMDESFSNKKFVGKNKESVSKTKKVKKEIPKTIPIAQKPERKPPGTDQNGKKAPRNSFSALYSPAVITYQDSSNADLEDDIKINGNSLGGHTFDFYRLGPWPVFAKYSSLYGEVFEGENFAIRSLEIGIDKKLNFGSKQNHYAVGFSALSKELGHYQVKNDSVIEEERLSALGLGIHFLCRFVSKGNQGQWSLEGSYHGLEVSQATISIGYETPLSSFIGTSFGDQSYLRAEIGGQSFSLNKDDYEISYESFQLFMGPKFLF